MEASLGFEAHANPVNPSQPPRTGLVFAIVVALVGVVWILQGLGTPIGGGFMVGDVRWSAAGVALVGVAGLLAWRRLHRTH
jgi:hypothetical protein